MEKFSFLSEVSRRTRTESPVLDRASAKLVSARSGNSRVRRKRMLCGPYAEREQLVPSMKRECSYCKCSDLSTAGREKNVRGLGGGQARRERCASTTTHVTWAMGRRMGAYSQALLRKSRPATSSSVTSSMFNSFLGARYMRVISTAFPKNMLPRSLFCYKVQPDYETIRCSFSLEGHLVTSRCLRY